MRVKTLTYDGQEYRISPLNLGQEDELASHPPLDVAKMSQKELNEIGRKRAVQVVCWGMNNAATDGAPRWTDARCHAELDTWALYELMKEILKLSRPEGEASAPPTARGEESQSTSVASAAG